MSFSNKHCQICGKMVIGPIDAMQHFRWKHFDNLIIAKLVARDLYPSFEIEGEEK